MKGFVGEHLTESAVSARVPSKTPTLAQAELARSALFAGVDLDPLWHQLSLCEIRELAPGETLIQKDEQSARAYVVLGGQLGVHIGGPEDDAVATIGPGDSVGELAALDNKPRSASVVALEHSRALAIDSSAFWHMVQISHRLSLNLLGILGERLRGNNAKIVRTRQLKEQYKRHASTDPLTGLHNRRGLSEVGRRILQRLKMKGEPLCVLMIDVDHFKRFNDEHGHQAGDQVLFAVGQVLKSGLRPTDFVARYGGEEFTVLLPEAFLDGARIAGDRIREQVKGIQLTTPSGSALPSITVSIGAAQHHAEQSLDEVIAAADAALYLAKRHGRDRVELAHPPSSEGA